MWFVMVVFQYRLFSINSSVSQQEHQQLMIKSYIKQHFLASASQNLGF